MTDRPSNDLSAPRPGVSLIELQRAAVHRLRRLVREAGVEEKRLESARSAATAATATRFEKAESEALETFATETSRAEADRAEGRDRLQRGVGVTRDRLEEQWSTVVRQIEEKAVARRETAEKNRQEAIWLAETVYEATSNQPEEQFEQICKGLDGFAKELDETLEQAQLQLRRYRQPVPTVNDEPPPSADTTDAPSAVVGDEDDGRSPDRALLESSAAEARDGLDRLRRLALPRLFRSGLPVIVLLLPAAIAAGVGYWLNGQSLGGPVWMYGGATLAGTVLLMGGAYALARSRVHGLYRPLSAAVTRGRLAVERCRVEAARERDEQGGLLVERRDREIRHAQDAHGPLLERIDLSRERHLKKAEEEYPDQIAEVQAAYDAESAEVESTYTERMAAATAARDAALAEASSSRDARLEEIEATHAAEWTALVERWRDETTRSYAELETVREAIGSHFPDVRSREAWESWRPPTDVLPAVPVGWFTLDLALDATTEWDGLEGVGLPSHPDLALPGAAALEVPAILGFPDACSLLLTATGAGSSETVAALRSAMFLVMVAAPAGKVRFTIIDPVGLGQNFAAFMHLADYDGTLVTDRIWTEERHIEQRLLDVTEHMENVIQKYLRNQYETIAAYNADAGEIAEPYRFVAVANLPVNFNENAARRLTSIAASGARCGVFTLVAADTDRAVPQGFRLSDVATGSACVEFETDGRVRWADVAYESLPMRLSPPPSDDLLNDVLHRVGDAARNASRVEVPFASVAPPDGPVPADEGGAWWSRDCTDELRVALGRSGATRLQELALGKGVSQHVLVAGKTGSGKSTLLHALITNTAMWYPPEEVEFYLVDFKKGVEFRTYAANDLPHARVVAIESDREFGLSVLQRLDAELRERGERFREIGVQGLPAFRRERPDERMPRTLLVIDEFQEFFTEDDKVGQDASLLLDRLVRQGRAFGIHVLLGSQTLGGAYSLARSTIGQMAVRIALQCTESDSYLILSDDNAAARLLSRPGEAIYNDQGGLLEGNSPFQVVWLSDEERDRCLADVRALTDRLGRHRREPQIVFEGNVPAVLERNPRLAEAMEDGGPSGAPPAAWLGEAIAIKDPPAAIFRRQSGANLLLVGQRDEAVVGILEAGLVSLAAQGQEMPELWVMDGLPPDAPRADRLPALVSRLDGALPGIARLVDYREVGEAMAEIGAELERRQASSETAPRPVFLVINGLQRFRMLKQEEEFGFSSSFEEEAAPAPKPEKIFGTLLREGPLFGMHTLTWVDTVANMNRVLDRQALREFEQRVLFQMSASDSSQLIDSPAASRLGLHRAILFSEESGLVEKFRPYGLDDGPFLDVAIARIAARRSGAGAATDRA